MKSFSFTTQEALCCDIGSEVIACVDSALVVGGQPFITATIQVADTMMGSCRSSYVYGFTYDESQLVTPADGLTECDVTGVFCKGCLTDWVEWLVGQIEPPVSSGWALTGNAATVDGVNFLGTIDAIPFTLRVENTPAFRIDLDRNYIFDYASAVDNKNFISGTIASSSILAGRGCGIGQLTQGAWPAVYYEVNPSYLRGVVTNAVVAGGLQNAVISSTNSVTYNATTENSAILGGIENNIILQVEDSATAHFVNSNSIIAGGDNNWIFQTNPQAWSFGNTSPPQWFDYVNNSIIGGTDNWVEFSMNSGVESCDGAYLTCNWGAFVGGGFDHYIYGGSPAAVNMGCASLGGDGHWLGINGASRYCAYCTMIGNDNVYITPYSAGEVKCCSIIASHTTYLRANYLSTLPVQYCVAIGTDSTVLDNQRYSCIMGGRNHVIDAGVARTVTRNSCNALIAGDSNEVSDSLNCGIFVGQWNDLYTSSFSSILGGAYNNITASINTVIAGGTYNSTPTNTNSAILGGSHNAIASGAACSSHLGGKYLTIGDRSCGFTGQSDTGTTSVAAFAGIAYFGDVDLWVANTSGTAAKLKLIEPNATKNFSTTNYSSIEAQTQVANIEYKLPAVAGTPGQVLTIDTVVGTVVTLKWA